MSFSTDIKNEVTKLDSTREELISELSAIVRNSALISKEIEINIENNSLARRVFKLFKDVYDIIPAITIRKKYFNRGISYILTIKHNTNQILKDLSIVDSNNKYLNVPHNYIISDEELLRAYLRGLFISVGSLNDPKTSRYHLEFWVDNREYANFISKLLNSYYLNSKVLHREKNYVVYIKEAEKISDFLRIIKAYNAVMYYEDIRIYRDHKNMTNRLNNCEQANMDKVFYTASREIKNIERLKALGIYDTMDDKMKVAMDYRIKYPEYSLQELSDVISEKTQDKITKSGLNHRFRKINEILEKIDNKNKKWYNSKREEVIIWHFLKN